MISSDNSVTSKMIKQLLHIFAIAFFATQAFKICEGKILMSQNSVGDGIPEDKISSSTTIGPNPMDGDCRDLTLDACDGGEPPFNTIKDQGVENCQFICANVFTDVCTFFIYDRENELCEMYDYEKEIYVATCTRFGGPPTPSLAECQVSTDPCSVRKKNISPMSDITSIILYGIVP